MSGEFVFVFFSCFDVFAPKSEERIKIEVNVKRTTHEYRGADEFHCRFSLIKFTVIAQRKRLMAAHISHTFACISLLSISVPTFVDRFHRAMLIRYMTAEWSTNTRPSAAQSIRSPASPFVRRPLMPFCLMSFCINHNPIIGTNCYDKLNIIWEMHTKFTMQCM